MSENVTAHQFNREGNVAAEAAVIDAAADVMNSVAYATADNACPTTPRNRDNAGYGKTSSEVGDKGRGAADRMVVDPQIAAAAFSREEGRLGYRFVKRAFDIVFSAVVILVLLVPSIILCIAIRAESPGSPIYSQKRVGRIGRNGEVVTFSMYKFRSMHDGADEMLEELQELNEADGPLFKIKDDPRVTRIGRFIRKHSIDELPQFVNCFIGQLSTVGPRPPLPGEVAQYDEHAMRRLSIKPGLTGYWQVSGRSDTTFEDMLDLDLQYIESRTVLNDFLTVVRTVSIMFSGKGAC